MFSNRAKYISTVKLFPPWLSFRIPPSQDSCYGKTAWLNPPIASKVLMVYFPAPDSSRNYCKGAELLIAEYKISVYGKAAWLNLPIASKVLIVYFSAPDSSRNYCKGEELLIAEIQNISNPLNVCLNCLILQVIRTTVQVHTCIVIPI